MKKRLEAGQSERSRFSKKLTPPHFYPISFLVRFAFPPPLHYSPPSNTILPSQRPDISSVQIADSLSSTHIFLAPIDNSVGRVLTVSNYQKSTATYPGQPARRRVTWVECLSQMK